MFTLSGLTQIMVSYILVGKDNAMPKAPTHSTQPDPIYTYSCNGFIKLVAKRKLAHKQVVTDIEHEWHSLDIIQRRIPNCKRLISAIIYRNRSFLTLYDENIFKNAPHHLYLILASTVS